jgi:hypothetical protein
MVRKQQEYYPDRRDMMMLIGEERKIEIYRMQKVMTAPPISAARPNQKDFDQSFKKVLSIVSDDPF